MSLIKYFNIGDRLKLYRKNINIKQQDMAKILNIPRSTYANYENGTRLPSRDFLRSFASYFNVSLNEVIGTDFLTDKERSIFSTNLKLYLFINGISHIDLATELNYDLIAVTNWYSGNSMPSLEAINKIADYFNIEYNDLVSAPDRNLHTDKIYDDALQSLVLAYSNILMLNESTKLNGSELSFFYTSAASLLYELEDLMKKYIQTKDSFTYGKLELPINNENLNKLGLDQVGYIGLYYNKILSSNLSKMKEIINSIPESIAQFDFKIP